MQEFEITLPGWWNKRARRASPTFAVGYGFAVHCSAVQRFLEFQSLAALRVEIERDLSKGRAWLRGQSDAEQGQTFQLVLVHPESRECLPLDAVVVLSGEAVGGVGLELSESGERLAAILHAFAEQRPHPAPAEPGRRAQDSIAKSATIDSEADRKSGFRDSVRAPKHASGREACSTTAADDLRQRHVVQPAPEPSLHSVLAETDSENALLLELVDKQSGHPEKALSHSTLPPSSAGANSLSSQGPREERGASLARSPAERVRTLDQRGRDRCARRGSLAERVALERAFGAQVWDSLLSNPQLTGPEIARIAKNRTLTQPTLKTIVGMSGWLSKPEVRRALLSNPRLTDAHAERVLRALPLSELRLVPKQAAYPARVRRIAQRLLP